MYKLRELERNDIPTVNKWRNDKELIDRLGAPFRYISQLVDEKWFESYMNSRNTCVRCAIVTEESDDIIGLVSLIKIDQMNQSAEFHIMIGDKQNRGKGAGLFALKEMLRHAFLNLNLQRVELTVNEDNVSAIHLYEKVGFVREGMKRKARFKNGEFINMYMYSILRDDFLQGYISQEDT